MRLIVSGIQKSYGRNIILKEINLEVKSGECVGIVGENGCGKTTLLSVICGIEKPDSGTIVLEEGSDKRMITEDIGEKIGYVPQINPLIEHLSVRDNLWLWSSNKYSMMQIADKYDLQSLFKKRVSHLSGGMKRRLAIACAMTKAPDILVMDEPTAGLDRKYKELIHNEMNAFTKQGGILIMVTHEMEEMQMCSHCFEIFGGRLRDLEQKGVDENVM